MTAKHVALVSLDTKTRRTLAAYLTSAGFAVDEHDELAAPGGHGGVVLVATDATSPDELEARVRSWLKAKNQRVVVVTSRPAALRELQLAHAARLRVLAAPAFGWDVVNALRPIDLGVQ